MSFPDMSFGAPQQAPGAAASMSRLVRAMQEVGYGCSIDASTFRGVIQQVDSRVDDQVAAEVLAFMARTTPTAFPGMPPNTTMAQDQLVALSATLAAIANGGVSPNPGAPLVGDGSNSGVVGWAWKVVLDVIKSINPALNWPNIADLLDQPNFLIQCTEGFHLLVHAYRYGSGGDQFPTKAVVGRRWSNETGQLSFLQFAVPAPPEVFSFASSERKLPPVEGLQGGKSPTGTPNQAWLSIDLLQILCHFIVDTAKRPVVLSMLEYPMQHCPEVLLLAMASVPEDTQLLQREVYSVLLPPYLKNSQVNTQLVLRRLWGVNAKLVKEMLVEYFVQDPENLPRIYDICTELQALPELLSDTPSCRFAVHLAVYAAQTKSSINLEQWASARCTRDPVLMAHELVMFLYAKTQADAAQQSRAIGWLSEGVVQALLRVLQPLRTQFARDFVDAYTHMADAVSKRYPGLKAMLAAPLFSPEVETEAKNTLQRVLYSAKWEDAAQQVQKLKSSGNPREQELLACFLFLVLNELPAMMYVPKQDKEVHAAAMLFGSLFTNQILPSLGLGMALRIVLFSLRGQPGTQAVAFGLAVLRQIVRMLRPWGPFCEQLLLTKALRESDPELCSHVEAAFREYRVAMASGELPPVTYTMLAPVSISAPPGQAAAGPPPGITAPPPGAALSRTPTAAGEARAGPWGAAGGGPGGVQEIGKASMEGNDIEGELESQLLSPNMQQAQVVKPTLGVNTMSLENASEKHPGPPESVHDRVHFIINNLSDDNLEQKAMEVKGKVLPQYVGWFSEYMAKRAAQEPNYHPLYLRMLDKMADKALFKQLVRSTYFYVRLLFTGERSVKDSNDRQLLKNLGTWLGSLTFKREKPVLSKELDLKQLLIDGYQRGRLISVLPFLSNLLCACEESKVFNASNPMISGLLSLLEELHNLPGLRFNSRYSIEVILKIFNNPKVEPTHLLATLPRDHVGNQDWGPNMGADISKGLMSAEATSNMHAMMNQDAVKAFNQNVVGQAAASKPAAPPGMGMPGGQLGAGGGPGMGGPHSMLGGMPPGMQGRQQNAQPTNAMVGPGGMDARQDMQGMGRPNAQAVPQQNPQGPMTPMQGAPPGGPSPPTPTGLCLEHNPMIQYHSQNAVINPSLGAIAERLQLKRHVPVAIERAIWEILNAVVERSVTIACYTTSEVLCKDFALDSDETRVRKAAHLMVSSLAGSLSLVTCKDPLRIALANQLTQLIAQHGAAGIEKAMLDQVVTVVVQDNLDSCCQVFEHAATNKAVRDMDKQLAEKYEERLAAKKQGRPYADNSAFHGRFPASLPESLRPRPGVVSAMQLRVYEDFARIPRVPPPATPTQGAAGGRGYDEGGMPKDGHMPGYGHAVIENQYMSWQNLVDNALVKSESSPEQSSADLSALMNELVEFAQATATEEALHLFVQRIFRHLFEVGAPVPQLVLKFYTSALRSLCESLAQKGAHVNLVTYWGLLEDDRRWNRDMIEYYLRSGMVNVAELDAAMARALLASRNPAAAETVYQLIKALMRESHTLTYPEFAATLESLQKVAMAARANGAPSAQAHLDMVNTVRSAGMGALVPNRSPQELLPAAVRDKPNDPPNAEQQVVSLVDEWLHITNSAGVAALATNPSAHGVPEADRTVLTAYLAKLRASPWLKDESTTERFLRLGMDIAIAHCNGQEANLRPQDVPQLFRAVDAFCRLLVCLTLHVGGLAFLKTTLNVLVGVIKKDADSNTMSFNGRPHLRLMVGLLTELPGGNVSNTSSQESLDPMALRYLRLIAEALYALQPLSVPGWAFCWLTAISHRACIPRLLLSPASHGWVLTEHLLVALLRFLEPHLRSSDQLTECVRALYKGTLRLLLVLLHDFPEFLCEHHFPLCDVIPVSCVQLRNLVLSAFPRSMRLPDPFTPGLKVDLLPEIMQPPRMVPDPDHLLDRHEALRNNIDSFLRNRTPPSLPTDLCRAFKLSPADAKAAAAAGGPVSNYNTALINAVVMYVGTRSGSAASLSEGPALDMFLRVMQDLDSEGRYLVLNAAANQLRYPNSHTYTFSCMLLQLFAEIKVEVVQEQITRVLLERLVVNRPHPWGLLITFIELIKNPRYMFWQHEFTRNGPDVERLFKNVAASCMAHNSNQPGGAGGLAGAEQRKEPEEAAARS